MTDKHNQTMQLPDGRTLGFAEYGYTSGHPLLFFHGFPSSRFEARAVDHLARRCGVRLICPERPGHGLSTFQPGRRIIDWPQDVQALTSHLGLRRYAVLGGSGGGPYAVACAYSLSKENLSAVGLLASAGPWDAGIKDIPWSSYFLYLGVTYAAWPTKITINGLVSSLKWFANTNYASRSIEQWLETITEKDEEPDGLTIQQRREELLQAVFEAFKQGSGGPVQEAQLLSQPWGFKLEDAKFNKVQIWHGRNDSRAPISQIQWMVDRLPHCELYTFDAGHFVMAEKLEQIFEELIPETKRSSTAK